MDEIIEYVVTRIEKAAHKKEFWKIKNPKLVVYLWKERRGWQPIKALVTALLNGTGAEQVTALEILSSRTYSATDRITEQINPNPTVIEATEGIEQYKAALTEMKNASDGTFQPWYLELIDELINYQPSSNNNEEENSIPA